MNFVDRLFKIDNYPAMNFSIEIGPHTDLETLPSIKDVYITMLPGGDYLETAQKAGDLVKKGDVLLTIEAMKMETVLNAENDFRIKKIYTTIGSQIDAKDLLIEFD